MTVDDGGFDTDKEADVMDGCNEIVPMLASRLGVQQTMCKKVTRK